MLDRLDYRSRRSTEESKGNKKRSVICVRDPNAQNCHTIVRLAVSSLVYQVDKVHRPPGMKPVKRGTRVSLP